MFGAVGYPLVFQTDNGTEFTAEVVLNLVREWNPCCKTVTGRRRTPRDQGSVERANASIKSVIAKLEQQERNRGNPDPNWVRLTPAAMSAINCSIVDGLGQQSAYSHVFGMEFTIPLLAPPSQVHKARTVEDLEQLINSPLFRQKLIALGELEAIDTNDKVDDNEKTDGIDSTTKIAKELFPDVPDQGHQTQNVCEEVIVVTKPPDRLMLEVSHSDVCVNKFCTPLPPRTTNVKTALQEPNVRTRKISGKDFRLVNPRLLCEFCDKISPSPLLTIAENAYYKLNSTSKRWWCADMVSTFGILMSHDVHRPDVSYTDCGTPTKSEYLKEAVSMELPLSVKLILSIAHAKHTSQCFNGN